MKKLVEWLISIERMSGSFYKDAAAAFRHDEVLTRFLDHLAADERWHSHIIEIAADYVQDGMGLSSVISMDPETRAKVEDSFQESNYKLAEGILSKNDVLESIFLAEFSEWNDIFLYVINSLKESTREFDPVAAKMQQHKRFIEEHLATFPELSIQLSRLRDLPALWKERILLVDDYPPIREFLTSLLSRQGKVESATDGNEGLVKVVTRYYDVIVSDINMPAMDGIEFFLRAVQIEPGIWERFLFLVEDQEARQMEFLTQNGLKYLMKPAPIKEISSAVKEILLSSSRTVVKDR
jgi:CheY-like chemotaxis protein